MRPNRPARRLLVELTMVAVSVGGVTVGAIAASAATPAASVGTSRVGNPPDPKLAAAVAAWVTGGGSDNLKALGADFAALEAAANSEDLTRMASGCDKLLTDVKAAQSYDPIPDAAAEKDWANALSLYARGAEDCANGARTQNYDLITQASDEIIQGSNDLDMVTARLKVISGG